ncbi:MAG: TadE/TadG family type IV pilus assembly protein [Methyloligellaceae bacterium]
MWGISEFARSFGLFQQDRRGAFAVELALISPVMLILLLGALDMTAALHRQIDLQNAVKTGAHYASIHKPLDGDMTKVVANTENAVSVNNWYNRISPTTASVTASLVCGCTSITVQACDLTCPAGERRSVVLQINVTQNHQTLFSYPVIDDVFPLTASVSTRIQ